MLEVLLSWVVSTTYVQSAGEKKRIESPLIETDMGILYTGSWFVFMINYLINSSYSNIKPHDSQLYYSEILFAFWFTVCSPLHISPQLKIQTPMYPHYNRKKKAKSEQLAVTPYRL